MSRIISEEEIRHIFDDNEGIILLIFFIKTCILWVFTRIASALQLHQYRMFKCRHAFFLLWAGGLKLNKQIKICH